MMRTLLGGILLGLFGALASPATAEEAKKAPYVHVVIFRMKADAPSDAVEKAIGDCHTLLSKIPVVRSVRAGRPSDKGTPDVPKMKYDFGLLVLVDDAEGLDGYLKHPLHLKYVEKHGPYFDMSKLEVFDFQNQAK
jgi:hypothetical protein